jgi:hypothetical protein
MAANSIREQILLRVKTVLEAVTVVGSVKRKVISSFVELKDIPFPSFPVVFMTAGLPVPKNGGYVTLRESSQSSKVRSVLSINLRTYGLDKSDPDSAVSTVAEDIWDALYADPTVNSLAEAVTVIPIRDTMFFEPFYRFDMIYNVEYIHDTDNI